MSFELRGRARSALSPLAAWGLVWLVACGAPQPASDRARRDPLTRAAQSLAERGCDDVLAEERAPATASIPSWSDRSPANGAAAAAPGFDVVVYTAHPDDEAMYAGGTMARLVKGGRRVAFVTMSHGEGGRLLERRADGGVDERRDYPRPYVIQVRDREVADAARRIGVAFGQLYPGDANVDDAWTTSCSAALAHWQSAVPGGLAGMLQALVDDLRTRRPRVVITLDPRDDPQGSHHGHHKAVGVLTELAARLAADARVSAAGQLPVHVVEELLTAAPRELDTAHTIAVPVDVTARLHMLGAYRSQFVAEKLAVDPIAQRPVESFVLRWRARGAPAVPDGARLLGLVRSAP